MKKLKRPRKTPQVAFRHLCEAVHKQVVAIDEATAYYQRMEGRLTRAQEVKFDEWDRVLQWAEEAEDKLNAIYEQIFK